VSNAKLKLMVLLLTISLLGVQFALASHSIKQKSMVYLNKKTKQFFSYIYAKDHYDYGHKAGKKFFFFYKFLGFFARLIQEPPADDYAEKTLENLSIYSPWLIEELQGLSNSTGIGIKNLLNIFNLFTKSNQCTVILVTGNATKNNETFLAQNLDMRRDNVKNVFLTHVYSRFLTNIFVIADIETENYSYVFCGLPIFYELPLMNQAGLGFGGNGLSLTKNITRYVDEKSGVSTYSIERLTMMRCKNIFEVQKLWENIVRASGRNRFWPHFWDNSIPSFCDKNGDIITIEQTHNYICFVYRNSTDITKTYNGILWHANHHQFLDPNLTGSVYPGEENVDQSTFLRAKRSVELLEKNYGKITIDIIKKIMRDHKGGTDKNGRDSSDICRYPDKNGSYTTVVSWIIQPKDMRLYFAHNTPDKTRYQRIDLADIFT